MTDAKSCANCGQSLSGDYSGALCPSCGLTYWKCGNCGFLVTAAVGPDTCPSCKEKCEFKNVKNLCGFSCSDGYFLGEE